MKFLDAYRRNPNFPNRYIPPAGLAEFLQDNLSDYSRIIGKSVRGRPIYLTSFGKGPIRILAWSQMHGNESNSTHAMLDMLETFKHHPLLHSKLYSQISLDFIFMLNPDGSETWERRNAQDLDMNRDFLKLETAELPLLKDIALTGNYDYALNLHEQRTIFTTDGTNPATLSFLSPSVSTNREITDVRRKSMAVIAAVYSQLNIDLPNQIGRYTDEFYPSSVGDNLSKAGLPTILFEGGYYPDDPLRQLSRKYYTVALYEALSAIARLNGAVDGFERYFEIPENRETHYDHIYRNVRLNTPFECILDIAVQNREIYRTGDDEISFVPIVAAVGDCKGKKGWKETDCTGREFRSASVYPKVDEEVQFEIV